MIALGWVLEILWAIYCMVELNIFRVTKKPVGESITPESDNEENSI